MSFETTVTATGNNTGATELTIFPPGEAVPSGVAATLWRGTAGLDMDQAQQAMEQLGRLRLVTLTGSGITLHDAVRDALREGLGETELARVHSGEVARLARFCVQVPFGIYFIVSGIRTLVIGGSSELGWSHLSVALTVGTYTFRKVFLEED